MECKYCDTSDYRGRFFDKDINIDGGNQNFTICIFDSPEDEGYVLEIDGNCTDIRVHINYCPMCGRELAATL